MAVPVIDLFAGPGGLGEGFSAFGAPKRRFRIGLSVEMEENAHSTLQLRAFFRQFPKEAVPQAYYEFLRGDSTREQIYSRFPEEAGRAGAEALLAELGKVDTKEIDARIRQALGASKNWVLIGGPPCQAYSIAGRSRNKGKVGYVPEDDDRHFLYREYLRIIAEHRPPVFIMENVKGLLSARINGSGIFGQIISDLQNPSGNGRRTARPIMYHIYSLVHGGPYGLSEDMGFSPMDFVVKSELYGIPQARHRVILLGLRDDVARNHVHGDVLQPATSQISVKDVIGDLPRVRSGLSHRDSKSAWLAAMKEIGKAKWLRSVEPTVRRIISEQVRQMSVPKKDRGAEFITHTRQPETLKEWFYDKRIDGVCNHTTRGHIASDLHRYMFAACFAAENGTSPVLSDFPEELLPAHRNVDEALKGPQFEDRFRVQIKDRPATTVVSHISKDGHYYIHYDPTQCRSLTVREAARLQTFPDNYFFSGPRTSQYHQVGNAVPPYLACQIAGVVWRIVERAGLTDG